MAEQCSFEKYMESYRQLPIVISSDIYHKAMKEQLQNAGIAEDKIINVGEMLTLEVANPILQRQYFDLPQLPHAENEIFVDCGCLNGETSKNFINWCNGTYQHIYAFEPDLNHWKNCRAALTQEKADIYSLGVWSQKDKLHFAVASPGASFVSQTGEMVIEVDSLDNLLGEEKVTFIKMDIEGSELEALRGARE